MTVDTTWMLWTALALAAGEPGTVTVTKPAAAPAPGVRHYVVQLRILEVDAQGRRTLVAEPILQTTGAAAGVTVEGDTGRRFEFHFSAAEPGAPAPLPVTISDEVTTPRPIFGALPPTDGPALQQKVSVKAVQQPRRDVLRDVAKQAGLTVAMEPETAAAAASKLAVPITFEIDNAPLDEVLKRLVEPLQMGYSVKQDLVLIGFQPPAAVADRPPVVPATPQPNPVADWQIRVYGVSDLVAKSRETGRPEFAPLLQELQRSVLPESWADHGGEGSIRGFDSTVSLVVRQTTAGHKAVAKFLEELRKTGAPMP